MTKARAAAEAEFAKVFRRERTVVVERRKTRRLTVPETGRVITSARVKTEWLGPKPEWLIKWEADLAQIVREIPTAGPMTIGARQ